MVFPTIRSRLRVVVLVKAYVVRRQLNYFARVILTIDTYLPCLVTEEFQIGFRDIMMTFLVQGSIIRFNSAIEKIPELPMEYKGQAPSQKPAPLDQHILNVLFELQHPLRRQHLPRQALFQHGRLIERFGQRLEDGFHDVMWVAAVQEIHVEIEPTVGNKGLKEIFEQA